MNQPRSARHVCCVLLHRKLNSRISFVQHHPRVVEIDSRVVLQGASSCTLLRFRVFVQITCDSDCPSWSGFDRRNHDWTGFTLVGFLYFVTAVTKSSGVGRSSPVCALSTCPTSQHLCPDSRASGRMAPSKSNMARKLWRLPSNCTSWPGTQASATHLANPSSRLSANTSSSRMQACATAPQSMPPTTRSSRTPRPCSRTARPCLMPRCKEPLDSSCRHPRRLLRRPDLRLHGAPR